MIAGVDEENAGRIRGLYFHRPPYDASIQYGRAFLSLERMAEADFRYTENIVAP